MPMVRTSILRSRHETAQRIGAPIAAPPAWPQHGRNASTPSLAFEVRSLSHNSSYLVHSCSAVPEQLCFQTMASVFPKTDHGQHRLRSVRQLSLRPRAGVSAVGLFLVVNCLIPLAVGCGSSDGRSSNGRATNGKTNAGNQTVAAPRDSSQTNAVSATEPGPFMLREDNRVRHVSHDHTTNYSTSDTRAARIVRLPSIHTHPPLRRLPACNLNPLIYPETNQADSPFLTQYPPAQHPSQFATVQDPSSQDPVYQTTAPRYPSTRSPSSQYPAPL